MIFTANFMLISKVILTQSLLLCSKHIPSQLSAEPGWIWNSYEDIMMGTLHCHVRWCLCCAVSVLLLSLELAMQPRVMYAHCTRPRSHFHCTFSALKDRGLLLVRKSKHSLFIELTSNNTKNSLLLFSCPALSLSVQRTSSNK